MAGINLQTFADEHHADVGGRERTPAITASFNTGDFFTRADYVQVATTSNGVPVYDTRSGDVPTFFVLTNRPGYTRSYYSLEDVLGCMPAGESIREGDIVVFYTGWDQYNWTKPTRDDVMYFDRHPGPRPEVIDYLIDQRKIKWLGADLAFIQTARLPARGGKPAFKKIAPDWV